MDECEPLLLGAAAHAAVQAAAVRVGLDGIKPQRYEPYKGRAVQVDPNLNPCGPQVHPRFTLSP